MIVDANVLTSALLGTSLPLLFDLRTRGMILFMPRHQFVETRLVVTRKSSMPVREFELIAKAVVEVIPSNAYEQFEETARIRLQPRGQPDWPVLAAAMAYNDEIWSNDRDFFGVGMPVWTTANVKYASVAG